MKSYRAQLFDAMIEQKINTPEQIERGLSKARKSTNPFLPAPGEFCSWCQASPEERGFLSPEDAFLHAISECGKGVEVRNWHDSVVFTAATRTGFYSLKGVREGSQEFRALRARFYKYYSESIDRHESGEAILELPGRPEKTQKIESTPKAKKLGETTLKNLKGLFDE